jgi:hypothetical protein
MLLQGAHRRAAADLDPCLTDPHRELDLIRLVEVHLIAR